MTSIYTRFSAYKKTVAWLFWSTLFTPNRGAHRTANEHTWNTIKSRERKSRDRVWSPHRQGKNYKPYHTEFGCIIVADNRRKYHHIYVYTIAEHKHNQCKMIPITWWYLCHIIGVCGPRGRSVVLIYVRIRYTYTRDLTWTSGYYILWRNDKWPARRGSK